MGSEMCIRDRSTGMAHAVLDFIADGKPNVPGAEHLTLDRFTAKV